MGKNCKEAHCCGACDLEIEKLDVSSLGKEAAELAGLFDEVNANLINALRLRKKILDVLHQQSVKSAKLKDELEKVVQHQHPVLIQFVFGK